MTELGWIVLLAAVVGGTVLAERALRRLGAADKARLLDAFAPFRVWSLAPLILAFVALFASRRYAGAAALAFNRGLLLVMVAYVVGLNVVVFRKLDALMLPPDYVRASKARSVIQLAGFLVAMVLMLWPQLGRPTASAYGCQPLTS